MAMFTFGHILGVVRDLNYNGFLKSSFPLPQLFFRYIKRSTYLCIFHPAQVLQSAWDFLESKKYVPDFK